MATQKRIEKFHRGACCVSIFLNEVEKNGQKIEIKKAVFQKRYKDSKGEWQTTTSLDVNEIPRAIKALEDSYDYMTRVDNGEE